MPRMIEVVIDSIRVSLTNQQRIIVLRDPETDRYLPIWIGPYEAESITIALQEVEVSRPLTHDLLKNMLARLNARPIRVEVIALRDDTFFGNIVLEYDGQILNIDSRPSDAVALAVRAHVPILVAKEVMDSASIIPEEESAAAGAEPPEVTPASSERLSVFEDFLENLNLDSMDDQDAPPEDQPGDDDQPRPKK